MNLSQGLVWRVCILGLRWIQRRSWWHLWPLIKRDKFHSARQRDVKCHLVLSDLPVSGWQSWGRSGNSWRDSCVKGGSKKNQRRNKGKKQGLKDLGICCEWQIDRSVLISVLAEWIEGQVNSCSPLAKWGINIQWGSCFLSVKIILLLFSLQALVWWIHRPLGVSSKSSPVGRGKYLLFTYTWRNPHLNIPTVCLQGIEAKQWYNGSFPFCFN